MCMYLASCVPILLYDKVHNVDRRCLCHSLFDILELLESDIKFAHPTHWHISRVGLYWEVTLSRLISRSG